jgi:hypothetical protein
MPSELMQFLEEEVAGVVRMAGFKEGAPISQQQINGCKDAINEVLIGLVCYSCEVVTTGPEWHFDIAPTLTTHGAIAFQKWKAKRGERHSARH